MGLSFPKSRSRVGCPHPRIPVFKVPATRICCKPQEAPHKGLLEETPALPRASGALLWYPHCHLLWHATSESGILGQLSLSKSWPPSVTICVSLSQAHSPPGKTPSSLGAHLRARDGQGQPLSQDAVTPALASLCWRRLLSFF